jgi:hypothetical protein
MMVPRTAPLRLWLSAETAAELGSKIADGKKTDSAPPARPPSPGVLKAAQPAAAAAERAGDAVNRPGRRLTDLGPSWLISSAVLPASARRACTVPCARTTARSGKRFWPPRTATGAAVWATARPLVLGVSGLGLVRARKANL